MILGLRLCLNFELSTAHSTVVYMYNYVQHYKHTWIQLEVETCSFTLGQLDMTFKTTESSIRGFMIYADN